MKNLSTRALVMLCCSVFLTFFNVQQAKASHAMGADLSYYCVDPINHKYVITFHFYRDCQGIDAPTSVDIFAQSLTCGLQQTYTLPELPCPPVTNGGQPCEVSPLCFSSISQSTCNGGSLPGVEAFTYQDTITLPQACTDWTFSYDICCRNAAITNLLNASGEDLYVQATLDNVTDPNESSPVFTTLPVPFICVNQPFSYNHGAVAFNGDSLVYTLVNPLGASATPISYNSGFSPTHPMTVSGNFNFNSTNGQMNFTPSQVQVAVVTVLVQSYHNGVLVGSTMRDIQVVVVNLPGCANPTPYFTGAIDSTVVGGVYIDSSLIQVCPGNLLTFNTSAFAAASNSDSLYVLSNISQAIPNATYTTGYITKDSIFGSFSWTPTGLDTGLHSFIVTVKNNHCPLASNQAYAITIAVLPGTYAGPDLYYCPSGGPVQLQAYGGSQFTWTPTAGLNNPNIGNPLASPAQTTDYIVTSNLSSQCKNKDTVRVFRVPDFILSQSQSKDTICRFDFSNLHIVTDAAYAPYTYVWTPAGSLDNAHISDPVAQPDTTTNYIVTVTSDSGCVRRDTLRVVISGQGPSVTLTSDKSRGCVGDTIHISALVSPLPCGLNVVPCQGNFDLKAIGAGTINDFNGATPYNGSTQGARMQSLYRASELQAAGMQPGTITDLIYDVAFKQSAYGYNAFTIKMGCTDKTELVDFVPNLSQVMSVSSYEPVQGSNDHLLDVPYDWDGTSNLIIETCFTDTLTRFNNFDDIVNASTTSYNSVVYANGYGVLGCSLATQSFSTSRPNLQIVYCVAPINNLTYAWNPTTNLVYSPDTLHPFTILSGDQTYFLTVSDNNCNGGGRITVGLDTSYGVSAGPDQSMCLGNSVQLSATITGTPPTVEINSCGANATVCTGTPNTDYYVPSTTVNGYNSMFDGGIGYQLGNERMQILYLASNLTAAGFKPGVISSIGFDVYQKNSNLPFQNFNIKLGCTNKTELDTGWLPTTTLFSTSSYVTVSGWNDFTLSNTFDWDGNSNIVVEICWNDIGGYSDGKDVINTWTGNYNGLQVNNDSPLYFGSATPGTAGCTMPTNFFNGVWNEIPVMRMNICPPAPLPITYVWSPNTGLSSTTVANPTANPTTPTTYVVTSYFGGRCPKSDTVFVRPASVVPGISNDTIICQGMSTALLATGADTYTWTANGTLSCANCPNPVATPDSTTTYYVLVTDSLSGCNGTDSVTVFVQNIVVTPAFTDTTVDQGKTVTLSASTTGGNGTYNYLWTPSVYLNEDSTASVISTPVSDTIYTVIVTSGPCVDSAKVNVHVHILPDAVSVPDAFTPNGDGRNDEFFPKMMNPDATVKAFRVYNRWGQMVHDGNSPWDGKFKGAEQPVGTYIYYVVVSAPYKDDKKFDGSVMLLR